MSTNLLEARHTSRAAAIQSDTRPWGCWTVLHEGGGFKVKLIEVRSGHRLSLQYHHKRSEVWVGVAGRASATINGHTFDLVAQQTAIIPRLAVHRLGNPGKETVLIIEIQQGEYLGEDDIVRLEDDYQRIPKLSNR
jgi:mannose-6-phosphate isomerase